MNDDLLVKFDDIEKIHWWWRGRRTLLCGLIGNRQKDILDVGCGTGETLVFLKEKGLAQNVYGVDKSPLAVKYARQRGLVNVREGLASKLPYKNESFDLVLFLDVLEHIKDDVGAVKEAKRVLRPGGRVIVTSPAQMFIWSAHDENQGHFRRYERNDVFDLAGRVNMKLEYMSFFNFFLSPIIVVVRLFGRTGLGKRVINYDNYINYNISKNSLVNSLLTIIFWVDVMIARYMRWPFGISVAWVFGK